MPDPKDDSSVRVALRVRPQLAREKIDMCRVCTSVAPGQNQVMLGQDRAFTFDHVFDMESQQHGVYNSTVHSLIEGCFDGYNATVFAYGQTGSGKTYTMGTGFEPGISEEQRGIVPRAVHHLFTGIEQRRSEALGRSEPPPEFKIHAQFMELYNEEILDLFDSTRDVEISRNKKSHIKIHEDAQGGIYVVGVTTRTVSSEQETLQCLQGGALSRTTGSTNMNAQSSRSHAIFTLHIKQQRLVRVSNEENEDDQPKTSDDNAGMNEFETLTAKFHFVDLAGSERLKRTGATGDRAKEGISINCGLLALGNVISALGDPAKKSSHVPYRDSKLTRLLQDSLGGNSMTLMIACVSPSDRDFMETLNTLRYANRAKNIKNVVVANQDKTSRQLAALRNEIRELQEELLEYKQGKRQINAEGVEEINDLFHENTMLQTEIENLRQRVKAMQETIDSQTARISVLVAEQARWRLSGGGQGDGEGEEMMSMVEGYVKEIEDLRAKLVESESLNSVLRRKNVHESPVRAPSRAVMSPTHIPLTSSSADFSSRQRHYSGERIEAEIPENSRVASVLAEARKQVEHDQEKMRLAEAARDSRSSKSRQHSHSDKDAESADEKEDVAEKEDGVLEQLERDEVVGEEDAGEEDGEEEEEDEDEDKDSSDSNSEDEDEAAQSQLQEDLADLACEINIKQRLIEELETSQRRLQTLKTQYEEKMISLQSKIRETEMERDKILANMGSLTETRTKEKAEKIRKEFEIKLKQLTSERDRMQKASKEHSKLLKSKSQYERQMKVLTGDLTKMKEAKVKLMKQIREEQQRSRQKEVASNRAIQQLKKESRKHENRIRSLEAEAKQKEIVLKRRQEEVQLLRKQSKPMSDKAAGRVISRRPQQPPQQDTAARVNGPATSLQAITAARRKHPLSAATQKRRHERKGTSEYSSKAAKQKWMQIERRVTDIVNRRQTITHMERDMERYLHHRQRLSKKRERTFRRRDEAIRAGKDAAIIAELNDQIDGLNANIEYVQEQVTECQANIMEVMEGKDEVDTGDVAAIIDNCCLQEAKYMLEHFLQLTLNKGQHASQKEYQVKELEAKLHQEEQNSFLQQQLLQHVLSGQEDLDVEFDGLYVHPEPDSSSSAESSRAPSPVETSASTQNAMPNHANTGSLPTFDYHQLPTMPASQIPVRTTRDKARRRTATPEELLYASAKETVNDSSPLLPLLESNEPSGDDSSQSSETNTIILPPPRLTASRRERDILPRPGTRNDSPSLRRKLHSILHQPQPLTTTPTGSVEHTPDPSPPNSPPPSKGRSDNVFSRLTQSNSPAAPRNGSKQTDEDDGGIINPVPVRPQGKAPLVCSYTAEGHTKAVLSVQATNELLFSGSKDRTVKIWKLETGQEMTTLSGHPNNVVAVRYNEKCGLVFSVSTAYIRVWDIREPVKCIKTLSSSGLVLDGTAGSSSSRTVAMPAGESQINAIAVNDTGTRLYVAAGNIIRVWSLTSFLSVCKLFGGPSAAIMCVAVDTREDGDYVFAGSKDHYIKVFDVPSGASGCLTAKFNLDPPHYDGIQSIAINKQLLFSGSRDACIKKWDIEKKQQLKTINSAHKDWICALDFLPGRDCLLSGCRGGYLKLWHMWDCSLMGELKAHTSPINSIATNATHIFTASSDRTISVWKPQGALENTSKENGPDG